MANQVAFECRNQAGIAPDQAEIIDVPPEYYQYRDEGCELAGSCLKCPFQRCIYDEPGGKHRVLKGWRDREMVNLFRSQKKNVKDLAEMFDVSTRTVQRALRGLVRDVPAGNPPGVSLERRANQDGE